MFARYTSTGICTHPEQQIHSCQNIGSQFLISNQKFNVTLKHCEGMEWTKDKVVEYSCLGDWVVGKNQYFAVANTKESRIDEKFRCFMKNRDDDYFLGQSNTPECNHIKTVEQVSSVCQEFYQFYQFKFNSPIKLNQRVLMFALHWLHCSSCYVTKLF